MLIELRIRDFAVIDDLRLELGPGLNALTGETGAGKSIIVGALSLLLGERASTEDVRAGAERATVEAVFETTGREDLQAWLDGHGVPGNDDFLILRREVQAKGRSRAWINGSAVTAGALAELGAALVDLHGQHEHQTLLRRDAQRDIVDAWAGTAGEAATVRRMYTVWRERVEALAAREARHAELAAQEDFLRFQLDEIAAADVSPDEEPELSARARRLEYARELGEGAHGLHDALYAGDEALADRVAEILGSLRGLARLDETLSETTTLVESAYHQLVEAGRAIGAYAAGVEHDPRALHEVQQRQEQLFRLKRKYGPELSDVVETWHRLSAEVANLEAADHDLSSLHQRVAEARAELEQAARLLSEQRLEAATRLASAVEATLPSLGMPSAVFQCHVLPRDELGPGGAEDIEFRISVNPGFEPRPLNQVSSGGELSRVMLALKALLAQVDRVPTLIFDEIDAGIGGVVASGVARELVRVARHHQVFVITHLPQLASRANTHLQVEKLLVDGRTATRVVRLDADARVREVARMLGGDPDSAASLQHAEELLSAS